MDSFVFDYPVRNYFGEGAVGRALEVELPRVGKRVMLAYGGGSVKRTGLYGKVRSLLEAAGKTVVDFPGIMPNPTYAKVQEGAAVARAEQIDFILAVGGGSVMDCSKAVSAQAAYAGDLWELEVAKGESPDAAGMVPVGCIVTLSGTGSEQNTEGVITNEELQVKGSLYGPLPSFAVLDPALTLTAPFEQFMSASFDALSHCMEIYFGTPRTATCASDDMNLAIQRNIIRNMRIAATDPENMDARSELVYDATMPENGILKIGKVSDFQAHMIQHQYGAYTHTSHGMGLAVIHPALYRALAPEAPAQFARWAHEVWGVADADDLAAANAGIDELAAFIKEIGLPSTFAELGGDASDETLRAVARTSLRTAGCAKELSDEEIFDILAACR